jgi:ribose 5-phosphate isomerase B
MIALGADHAGFSLKEAIKVHLKGMGYRLIDFGTESEDPCDYPDYGHKVRDAVVDGLCEIGILVCGTGIGMSIVANRKRGIRAALCLSTEMARLARQHNHANILCLGARLIGEEEAKGIVDAFLKTEPEGGRHKRRVEKIEDD